MVSWSSHLCTFEDDTGREAVLQDSFGSIIYFYSKLMVRLRCLREILQLFLLYSMLRVFRPLINFHSYPEFDLFSAWKSSGCHKWSSSCWEGTWGGQHQMVWEVCFDATSCAFEDFVEYVSKMVIGCRESFVWQKLVECHIWQCGVWAAYVTMSRSFQPSNSARKSVFLRHPPFLPYGSCRNHPRWASFCRRWTSPFVSNISSTIARFRVSGLRFVGDKLYDIAGLGRGYFCWSVRTFNL